MPNTPEQGAGPSHLEIAGEDDSTTEALLQKPRSPVEQPAPSRMSANLLVAIAYGAASIVTTLANKALLTSWSFGLVFSLLFLQNILTVAIVCTVQPLMRKRGGGAADGILNGGDAGAGAGGSSRWHDEFNFPLWERDLAVTLLPTCLMCIANLWAGMSALRVSSVPVYQTLKRMTPLPAMALDAMLRGKRFSAPVILSVLVVCFGAFLTGCGDLE